MTTLKRHTRLRNKKLHKLFEYLCDNYVNKYAKKLIRFRVTTTESTGCIHYKNGRLGLLIVFNPLQIKNLVKRKISFSEYYSNRDDLFTSYKNIKTLYRIAILHELYHAKSRLYNRIYDKQTEEAQADRFAIDRLQVLK